MNKLLVGTGILLLTGCAAQSGGCQPYDHGAGVHARCPVAYEWQPREDGTYRHCETGGACDERFIAYKAERVGLSL